jgi:hypothetical protein
MHAENLDSVILWNSSHMPIYTALYARRRYCFSTSIVYFQGQCVIERCNFCNIMCRNMLLVVKIWFPFLTFYNLNIVLYLMFCVFILFCCL